MIPSGEQNLKRNEPLNVKSIKQSSEPEKKWTAERKKYQAEPEKKRDAKRQRYWKSSEPGDTEAKYSLEFHRKSTTDKVTQRYVVHVHIAVATVPTATIELRSYYVMCDDDRCCAKVIT